MREKQSLSVGRKAKLLLIDLQGDIRPGNSPEDDGAACLDTGREITITNENSRWPPDAGFYGGAAK